jgi:hypothetical protein
MITEYRTPAAFSALKINLSGETLYKQAPELKIELQAQKNILDLIETNVINGELVVKFKDFVNLRSNEQIRILISGPDVNSISVNGSGNITTLGTFKPQSLFMHIKGSGNIFVPFLLTNDVDAIINGSGNIRVANGDVSAEELTITGSGSIDMQNVPAQHAATDTRGSGSIKINVINTLYATISGSGSVHYKGNPTVHAEISGSGKVVRF